MARVCSHVYGGHRCPRPAVATIGTAVAAEKARRESRQRLCVHHILEYIRDVGIEKKYEKHLLVTTIEWGEV